MIENLSVVDGTEVLKTLSQMKGKGFRLITVIGAVRGEKMEITYALEGRDRQFAAVRAVWGLDEEVPSVQPVFMNAMLYEWELVDIFDIKVEGCPAGIYLEPEKRGSFRRDA